MINREFWEMVAEKWSAKEDGIEIPDLFSIPDDLGNMSDILDAVEDMEDLLADFDI